MGLDWKKVLPVVSSAGVAITCGLSFYGGVKYKEKKKEKGRKALLYLLPGVGAAVGTIVSIAVNGHVTSKEIAALTGSCAFLVAEKDKFKDVMKERMVHDGYTPEEAKETIDAVQEEAHRRMAAEIVHNGEKISIPSAEESGHGSLLCIETWSGRAFRADREWVEAGIRKLNEDYITPIVLNEGTINEQKVYPGVCLNNLYQNWNICETHFGNFNGWPGNDEYVEQFIDMFDGLGIYTTLINETKYREPVLFIEFSSDMYPLMDWYEY